MSAVKAKHVPIEHMRLEAEGGGEDDDLVRAVQSNRP